LLIDRDNRVGTFNDFEDLDNGAYNLTTVDQPINSSPSSPRKDDIFTLSQISPRKEDDRTVAPARPSPTPVKTGRKRPVSVISDESSLGPRKRGKTATPFPVRRSSKPGVPMLQPTTCNNSAASSATTLLSSPRRRTRLGPHIRQALALKGKAIEEPSTSNVLNYPQQPDDSHKLIIFAGDQKPSKTLKPGASMGTGKQVRKTYGKIAPVIELRHLSDRSFTSLKLDKFGWVHNRLGHATRSPESPMRRSTVDVRN
jgi:hypothetical protein